MNLSKDLCACVRDTNDKKEMYLFVVLCVNSRWMLLPLIIVNSIRERERDREDR